MNFCPNCGIQRVPGRFCSGCGLEFNEAPNSQPEIPDSAPSGWYEDPVKTNQERYWDGVGWTEDIRPSGSAKTYRETLTQLMLYGKGFTLSTHCYNCGEPAGKRSKSCSLCGQEFQK
jgi:predicted amidophosphoribosyltransferase